MDITCWFINGSLSSVGRYRSGEYSKRALSLFSHKTIYSGWVTITNELVKRTYPEVPNSTCDWWQGIADPILFYRTRYCKGLLISILEMYDHGACWQRTCLKKWEYEWLVWPPSPGALGVSRLNSFKRAVSSTVHRSNNVTELWLLRAVQTSCSYPWSMGRRDQLSFLFFRGPRDCHVLCHKYKSFSSCTMTKST